MRWDRAKPIPVRFNSVDGNLLDKSIMFGNVWHFIIVPVISGSMMRATLLNNYPVKTQTNSFCCILGFYVNYRKSYLIRDIRILKLKNILAFFSVINYLSIISSSIGYLQFLYYYYCISYLISVKISSLWLYSCLFH